MGGRLTRGAPLLAVLLALLAAWCGTMCVLPSELAARQDVPPCHQVPGSDEASVHAWCAHDALLPDVAAVPEPVLQSAAFLPTVVVPTAPGVYHGVGGQWSPPRPVPLLLSTIVLRV